MRQPTPDFETAVIGGGVVGLAIAAELACAGEEVILLERNGAVGQETSARSSEVIHAGLYYPPGSLKARLCREGRQRLYRFCRENGVKAQRTGKLIVAVTAREFAQLENIAVSARANDVEDVSILAGAEARAREPQLSAHAALLSPSTGIVDGYGLMQVLEAQLIAKGATIALRSTVQSVTRSHAGGFELHVTSASKPAVLTVSKFVAAAGHGMTALARALPFQAAYAAPKMFLAKGHYYALRTPAPFAHLVYPLPGSAGLGIHFTRDLAGQGRFGPDVEWTNALDYGFGDDGGGRRLQFEDAIRKYWPALPDDALVPAYVGVRPKISGPREPHADFAIHGPRDHGTQGMVALYGIESPGLTSALAIGEYVRNLLQTG